MDFDIREEQLLQQKELVKSLKEMNEIMWTLTKLLAQSGTPVVTAYQEPEKVNVLPRINPKDIYENSKIGDIITLQHMKYGETPFIVAGKDHDGPGLTTLINQYIICKKSWNKDWKGCDYQYSDISDWLDNEFYEGFVDKELIKTVMKKTGEYGNSDDIIVSPHKCWLLSDSEIGRRYFRKIDEGRRYPIFEYDTDRIRSEFDASSAADWWLRSPGTSSSNNNAYYVTADGSMSRNSVTISNGVVVGLCI